MSGYETLTLLVSVIAVVISSVSLIRTRKLAKEQLELERVTAELSRLQIQTLEEDRESKTKPKFNVSLSKLGKSSFFYISNTSAGTAYDVDFELMDCDDSPLTGDFPEKFPHPEMKPNSRVKLIAAMHMGSPLKYQVKLTWKDAVGEAKDDIFWVTR